MVVVIVIVSVAILAQGELPERSRLGQLDYRSRFAPVLSGSFLAFARPHDVVDVTSSLK